MKTTNPKQNSAGSDTPAYFIYAGRTQGKQHLYYVLNSLADNDGKIVARFELKPFYTEKKIFSSNRIGYILPVTLKDGTNAISYKKAESVAGYWKTQSDLIEWRLTDSVADTVASIEKLADTNQLVQLLEPIARMYYKAGSKQARNAIIAETIRIITTTII